MQTQSKWHPSRRLATFTLWLASACAAALPASTAMAGTVVAWGDNEYGQTSVPAGLTGVAAIAGGGYHSLALKSDGTVVAWGNNEYGQATVPAGLTGVIAIAGGGFHSLALKSDGTVVAWGYNAYGQTGVPAGLTGVASSAAGYDHSIALKADFTLSGFHRPVDMDAVWNTVKGGATVPMKFNVFSAAGEVTDVAVVKSFTQQQTTCPGGDIVSADPAGVTTAGGTALRYADTFFIQNWKAP